MRAAVECCNVPQRRQLWCACGVRSSYTFFVLDTAAFTVSCTVSAAVFCLFCLLGSASRSRALDRTVRRARAAPPLHSGAAATRLPLRCGNVCSMALYECRHGPVACHYKPRRSAAGSSAAAAAVPAAVAQPRSSCRRRFAALQSSCCSCYHPNAPRCSAMQQEVSTTTTTWQRACASRWARLRSQPSQRYIRRRGDAKEGCPSW
eukprot:TRINITY_DN5683_c2_g2_i1.p1 TRINITY_DN5683_c2_g2~~TRINITY_DN5683_c2_g2_i1.p1  ORF type:complete len:205 (+),score=19.82 TRINITY_DN5683_c2_g2_i1:190-804(+)